MYIHQSLSLGEKENIDGGQRRTITNEVNFGSLLKLFTSDDFLSSHGREDGK